MCLSVKLRSGLGHKTTPIWEVPFTKCYFLQIRGSTHNALLALRASLLGVARVGKGLLSG